MADRKIIPTLSGNDAVNLYLQGQEAWNKWVEDNPEAYIDFSYVDFAKLRTTENPDIVFANFNFPIGLISFFKANFGEGSVSFFQTNFAKGNVNFSEATFGEGYVDFSYSNFGDGYINFIDTQFGEGVLSFYYANLGQGDVSFSQANIGNGHVLFHKASFGTGNVTFNDVNFGDMGVDFSEVSFGLGNISFAHANFGDGDVNFSNAIFGQGNIDFSHVKTVKGNIDFSKAIFGDGTIDFSWLTINGHFNFSQIIESELIQAISFKHSNFSHDFDISHNKFTCVVDLTQTHINNQVNIEGLICTPKKIPKGFLFKQVEDKADISRLTRLKEIAKNNNDKKRTLDFQTKEMNAKRWHEVKIFRGLGIDYLFYWLSHYGRSITIPSFWLMLSWLGFGYYYFTKTYSTNITSTLVNKLSVVKATYLDLLPFSAANMWPYLPSSIEARENGLKLILNGQIKIPPDIYTMMLIQGNLSFIFLFLIVLALINRYKK